jgi:hypothetical protein
MNNAALRAAVIAEWRGLPARKTRPDRWQSPADLIPKLMQRLGLRERLHETEVIDAWSKIVGEFIAALSAHSLQALLHPSSTGNTTSSNHSSQNQKLKARSAETIRDIRFRSAESGSSSCFGFTRLLPSAKPA